MTTPDELIRSARAAFRADAEVPPPLSLRGGNAVDDYDEAEPFDREADESTDAYIEAFAFWSVPYLDAKSWRHYLPRLIEYALRRPEDPAMAVEALIRSLRPPDRYPPRLATLTSEQEAVVVSFLEAVALGDGDDNLREAARQALEEWWLPGARHRTTPEEVAALRAARVPDHQVERDLYRLTLPSTLVSNGAREIPEEARNAEVWGGLLCGDAHSMVAVNITPRDRRTLRDILERAGRGLRAARMSPRGVGVPGARSSERTNGMTLGDSPAEPHRITLVAADAGSHGVLLTVRTWPRADTEAQLEQIVASFEVRVARSV